MLGDERGWMPWPLVKATVNWCSSAWAGEPTIAAVVRTAVKLSVVSLLIGTLMCFMTSSLRQVVVPECTLSRLLEPYETK